MLKYIFFPLILFGIAFSSCKKSGSTSTAQSPLRYKDELFASAAKSIVVFDIQPDYNGNATTLSADIYQPVGDNATSRAAIIFVHGGGFIGGTRDGANIPYLCEELAKRGYVTASIDYRIGTANNSPGAMGRAQIRAVQDLKSFIRYVKQNAATVKVDVTKLFITGSSAGGGTVMAAAYMDFGEQPAYMNPTSTIELQGYGNLNGHNASVKAVYSMWGAVSDTTWIKAGDMPVGGIQSINDPCIAWDYIASSCNVPGYPSYGNHAINARAKNLKIYTSLYGFNSDVHDLGLNFPNIDITIAQLTDFLLPLTK